MVGGLGRQPIDKKYRKRPFLEPHEKFVGFYAVVGTTRTLYNICYLYQRLFLEPHEKFVGLYAVVGTTRTFYNICYLYQRLLN